MKIIIVACIAIVTLALASCTYSTLKNVHSVEMDLTRLSQEEYRENSPLNINSIHFTNKPYVVDSQEYGYIKPSKMIWQQNTNTNEWTAIKVKAD
tara:strand:- start:1507 stop:1791 length:285 start_codon:yes stop_codon:yes gene_type:complete